MKLAGSAPSRNTRMGDTVASTSVGGGPSRRPPSTTTATSAASKACATCARLGEVERHRSPWSLLPAQLAQHPAVGHADHDGPAARRPARRVIGRCTGVGPLGREAAGHEHLDRARPAALEQPAQFVCPAGREQAHVLGGADRVVRALGVGRHLFQMRLGLGRPGPHHQPVPAHRRHADDQARLKSPGGRRVPHLHQRRVVVLLGVHCPPRPPRPLSLPFRSPADAAARATSARGRPARSGSTRTS